MKLRFYGFEKIVKRELGIISKDFDLIVMLLLAPVFYSLLYASFYINKTETKVPVAVVDFDKSTTSNKFINDLNLHQLIDVKERLNNPADIKDRLFSEQVQGAIIIPENFESCLKSGEGAIIKLYLNTQRFLPSNDINKAVNEVVLEYSKQTRLKTFALKGVSSKQVIGSVEPIKDDIHFLFNPNTTYGDFLIPALLVLILQQTLFIGLGESVAKEREDKTLREWYSSANNSTIAAIAGKGFFYLVVFLCYSIFFFIVHFELFKINFIGNYILLVLITMIFLIAMISMAIFVASFFNRKILALQVISFTSYPLFFLTGYAWQIFSMPKIIQWISYIVPGTPFFDIYTRIATLGAGLSEVLPALLHLIVLTILLLVITTVRMKRVFRTLIKNPEDVNTMMNI